MGLSKFFSENKNMFKNKDQGGSKGDLSNYKTADQKKARRKFLRDTKVKTSLPLK